MATHRNRRGCPSTRGRNRRLVALGAVVVVVALGLGVLMYLAGPRLKGLFHLPGRREAGPLYEQTEDLPGFVARVDHALYGALFRLGVEAEAISFERVERRRLDGKEWEEAHVRVRLPRRVGLKAAQAEMLRSLAPFGKRLSTTWQTGANGGRLYVRWDGLLTHCVELHRGLRVPKALVAPPPAPLPRVAVVMDDLGYDPGQFERVKKLRAEITCSVLPLSPHGRRIAQLAAEAGLECLLHLPMEAEGLPLKKLGDGALLMDMDAGQLLHALREDLNDLPRVSGVNNHMGSLLTANAPRMKVVLRELKRRNLFFLDSRTTSRSLGCSLAEKMGVKTAGRSIFLDDVQDKAAVLAQLAKLVSVARSQGKAVAICHPYPATLGALEEGLPSLKGKVRLVPVSRLVH
ncbi:MAG: divergent polysaccharide deacetylase family protein [Pseudomonadota bacterium]